MNWKKIKKDCPKAWKKMLEWKDYLEINESGEIGWHFPATPVHSHLILWRTYELRNFYDFFDENEIYILIELVTNGWYFIIKTEPNFTVNVNGEFIWLDNRPEAEQAGFTTAFEILENKLND